MPSQMSVRPEGEAAVRTGHPDCDVLRARVFGRVADGLLPDAVDRHLDRCREDGDVTRDLEGHRRGVCRRRVDRAALYLRRAGELPQSYNPMEGRSYREQRSTPRLCAGLSGIRRRANTCRRY